MTSNTVPDAPAAADPFITGLRRLADVLEAANAVRAWDSYQHLICCDDREAMAETVRRLGGTWEKSSTDSYFNLTRDLGGGVKISVYAAHAAVCDRVVTTETVTREVPDPERLAAVPMVTVEETVEHVEWICPDILPAPAREPEGAEHF